MTFDIDFLKDEFRKRFDGEPQIFRAPGRINLIGEHTDYNQGFVMPAAIGYSTYVLVSKRADRKISAFSLNFSKRVEISLDEIKEYSPNHHWKDYVFGVAAVLEELLPQKISGANLLIFGNVPIGSGLSSSASLETAIALALLDDGRKELSDLQIAKACQRAENQYVGAQCGIMDQYASIFGKKGSALLLDCRTLTHRELPLPKNFEAIICNTMVKHNLAEGGYNLRRAECAEALALFWEKFDSKIQSLSEISPEDLPKLKGEIPETLYRRMHHVVTENERTLHGADALEKQDLKTFGNLLSESHISLRDDYEVSCAELNTMVEIAQSLPGFYGGRMMGGGFGGCTVNLVAEEFSEEFCQRISLLYEKKIGITPEIYKCRPADGAGKI